MKLSDAQRFALYLEAVRGLLAKPGPLPTTTPPSREGTTKTVSAPFAVSVWAFAIVRASETVLDDDGGPQGRDSTPFG